MGEDMGGQPGQTGQPGQQPLRPIEKELKPEVKQTAVINANAFALPAANLAAALPIETIPIPKPSATSIPTPKDVVSVKTTTAPWNTDKLGWRIGADAVAAGSAAILIAPIITVIDKGIMENASGRASLGDSLRAGVKDVLRKPGVFLAGTPFRLVFMLYAGTYFTANLIDTASSTTNPTTSLTATTAGTSKFVATSTTNLALCLYKDNRFTQLFGSSGAGPARAVPLATFTLFTIRDCLTIFASFNAPAHLSPHLEKHMSSEVQKYVGATSAAQFVTPAAVQIISTPLHLLGLDLYNRPGVSSWMRVQRVGRDWLKAAFARMGRIIPAFGVGGVMNMKVRRRFMERLEADGAEAEAEA